ncbi:MAG: hypothetical protein V9H69_28060 [Anaerolineae bacterium]
MRGIDFDHDRAFQVLAPYQALIVPNFIFLKQLTDNDRRATGYEAVYDLVRNSERRAHQKRYDDALARLYRACEMFAQIRLKQRTPSLDSGNLSIDALPEHLRSVYDQLRDPSNNKVTLGLRQDYELLAALDDPAGVAYRARRETSVEWVEHAE